MKVKELIELLQQQDPEALAIVTGFDGQVAREVRTVEADLNDIATDGTVHHTVRLA